MSVYDLFYTYYARLRVLSEIYLGIKIERLLRRWLKSIKPLGDRREIIRIGDVVEVHYVAGDITWRGDCDDRLYVWKKILEYLAIRTHDSKKRLAVGRMLEMLRALKPLPHIKASHQKGAFHFAAENRKPWLTGIYEGDDGDATIIHDDLFYLRNMKFKDEALSEMHECLDELYQKCWERAKDTLKFNEQVIRECWFDIKNFVIAEEVVDGWGEEEEREE